MTVDKNEIYMKRRGEDSSYGW